MKHILNVFAFIGLLIPLLTSCIEKEYDVDKLNKNIELNIPPVPLGSFDTIFVGRLPIVPPDINIGVSFASTDTIRQLFDDRTISRFFYVGSSDVVISTKIDAIVLSPTSDLRMILTFHVIDKDGTKNEQVKIPSQRLVYGKNQILEIRFPAECMQFMQNARDLQLIFNFNLDKISFASNDYIFIRNAVLSTGGIQVKI